MSSLCADPLTCPYTHIPAGAGHCYCCGIPIPPGYGECQPCDDIRMADAQAKREAQVKRDAELGEIIPRGFRRR